MNQTITRFTIAVWNKNIPEINEILETIDDYEPFLQWYFWRSDIFIDGCKINYGEILRSAFTNYPSFVNDNFAKLVFTYLQIMSHLDSNNVVIIKILESHEKFLLLVE